MRCYQSKIRGIELKQNKTLNYIHMKTELMSVLEQIREAVSSLTKEHRREFYAEISLDDGRKIATEADAFDPGAKVSILSDDGESVPLDAGTYKLDDGKEIIVDADSRIAEATVDGGEVIEVEASEETKLTEYDEVLAGLVARFNVEEGLAKSIADFVMDVYAEATDLETIPEAEEEGYRDGIDDEKEDEREDMYKEALSEIATGFEALSKRLENLENQPAANPAAITPQGKKSNLSAERKPAGSNKFNAVERALQIINAER